MNIKMMNIKMRQLSISEIETIYHNYIVKDFAPDEVKPLERITELVLSGDYICFGFYNQNMEVDSIPSIQNIVAYAYVVFNKEKSAALLDYYAVVEGNRNQGMGSNCFQSLLKEIKESYKAVLLLEVERVEDAIDEVDKNLREKRLCFYKRNGMTLTPLKIWLYEVYYLIFISESEKMFDAKNIIHSVYQVLLKPDKIKEKLHYESNIKMIASDLDRTLLKKGSILSERTKKALNEADKKEIIVVAASGRAYDTLPEDVKSMPCFHYAITSNGAGIQLGVRENGKSIYHKNIDVEVAKELLKIYKVEKERFDVTLEAFVNGYAYCNIEYYVNPGKYGSESAKEYVQKTRTAVEDIEGFVKKHIDELESIDFISCDETNRRKLMELICSQFTSISVTSSISHLIEIAHIDVSKGNALAKIMEREDVRSENCISFGDALNDVSLFEIAGISVGMENSDDTITNYVNHITKSNEDDGVAIIIEKILKIQE